MPRHFVRKEVVCPFYKCETDAKIWCEGCSRGTTIQLVFSREDLRKAFLNRHCKSFDGYPRCPLFDAINSKYEVKKNE